MKIKKKDMLNLSGVLSELVQNRMKPQLAYIVAKNHVLVNAEVDIIRSAYKPVKGWDKVVKARQEVFKELGAQTKDGQVFSVTEDKRNELSSRMAEIDNEFADTIEAQGEYDEEFNESLEDHVDIDIEKISLDEMTGDIEPSKLVTLMTAGLI